MSEIISLIIIGTGLSMDAFSVSLGLGMVLDSMKKGLLISLIVGIMHFLMPILGFSLGSNFLKFICIKPSIILGVILLLIAFEMIINLIKKESKLFDLTLFSILLFSITVSLDSFTTGIGLKAVTNSILLASIIFSVCSCAFTFLGLFFGKIGSKYLGFYAYVLGIAILFITGIVNIIE